MQLDLIFWAVAFLAVFLSGLAKGGFAGVGMLATPLLSLVISPLLAASIMLPILVLQDLIAFAAYRRDVDWTVLKPILPGTVAGVAAGFLFALWAPTYGLTIALGIITLAFGTRGLVNRAKRRPPQARAANPRLATLAGFAAGATSMVSHAGAPPFQMYVLHLGLPRAAFVGCSAAFFFILNVIKLPPFFLLGQYEPDILLLVLALLPWALVASRIGIWLLQRTDPKRFEQIILVLMLLVGVLLIRGGLMNFF